MALPGLPGQMEWRLSDILFFQVCFLHDVLEWIASPCQPKDNPTQRV